MVQSSLVILFLLLYLPVYIIAQAPLSVTRGGYIELYMANEQNRQWTKNEQ